MNTGNCYFGCKLNAHNLKWSCKMFNNKEEADQYALSSFEKSISTKLLVTPCYYKNYIDVLKILLKNSLSFDISDVSISVTKK